jgi:hypothetical protein
MNDRDIESFVSLFAGDYESQQPAHPDRAFRGRDRVRENWPSIFASVPDFRADLLDVAPAGDTLWTEWRWRGTHADNSRSRLEMAGVIVMGVRDGLITWGQLYVEPIENAGAGIDLSRTTTPLGGALYSNPGKRSASCSAESGSGTTSAVAGMSSRRHGFQPSTAAARKCRRRGAQSCELALL